MSNAFSFNVSTILKADLANYANRVAFNLAQQSADDLEREYKYVIDKFYGEYSPKKYVRHADRGMEPGLPKSLNIELHPTSDGFYGGIDISSENMYDDYYDTPDNVLRHFLDGYHGNKSLNIKSDIETEKYMDEYCNAIEKNIQDKVPQAERYAKSFRYSILRF